MLDRNSEMFIKEISFFMDGVVIGYNDIIAFSMDDDGVHVSLIRIIFSMGDISINEAINATKDIILHIAKDKNMKVDIRVGGVTENKGALLVKLANLKSVTH
jgi:hypothetical protein